MHHPFLAFLVNLLVAFGAGYLADYVMTRMKMTDPIKIIVAVIIGIAVFLANPASLILT